MSASVDSPSCRWDRETVLRAIVQCPEVVSMWGFTEQLLSSTERVPLSCESIMNIAPPSFLTKEVKKCFLIVVVIEKGVIWKTRVTGLRTGIFVTSCGLVNLFTFHLKTKIGLESFLPKEMFKRRRKNVAYG